MPESGASYKGFPGPLSIWNLNLVSLSTGREERRQFLVYTSFHCF
jgi:hypothetical protein